ncbi:hypothetical protein Gbem_2789 [Citrifermentans bemidjiense Bem]|uniref:Uncharacterized protein n=1 Tax=Citrifermentans bemidjiense (strain ATCC BAA-1014 / DSM 16622 / JCM 12645 / Bem) TaxID=404380 RepID=B5EI91_CITBB|nr:hypothetical protein [Citrifermentans bemidjiense]ACH39793.1 hypothetical protein Gbem_2789 [Citrifermentans bemidjiense Bem]
MTDLTTIGAALSGIKAAVDIAKAIKNSDLSLEKAEMKYKVAELIEALTDAKMSVAEVRDVLQEKDSEIKRLKDALEMNGKVVRKGNYYVIEGDPDGEKNKYCLTCWDYDKKLVSLILGNGTIKCNICMSR